ncbi:MAG: hypothetical protein WC663_06045 [Patescibacteria group bacterium]|jgi:hypothetical protein
MKIVSSKEDIKNILTENNVAIFGVGGYPSTRSEIWPLVSDFEVICGNLSGEIDSVKIRTKVFVADFESSNKIPEKRPDVVLSDKKVIEHINSSAKNRKTALYFYKPSKKSKEICQKNNWTMLSNSPELFERFSSKLEFYKILEELKINRDIKIFDLADLEKNLDNLFDEWEKIVIQFVDEGGGRGTFFFNKNERAEVMDKIFARFDLINKKRNNAMKIVASRFVEGPVLSITGCITKDNGILTSYCQYQLIDIKEATKNKTNAVGVFCGHDWSQSVNIPDEINKQGVELVTKIGEKLKEAGLKGIFGLDLIWDKKNNQLLPLEINVRLLGTFPASVFVQLDKGEVPIVSFHILEFLNIPYKIKNEQVFKKDKKRNGGHLLIFNPLGKDVKCGKELKGGVYKLNNEKIEFLRLGVELIDIKNAGEFILTDGVPTKNLVYAKNGKILKIIANEEISEHDGKELNGWMKNVVKAVYEELGLVSA